MGAHKLGIKRQAMSRERTKVTGTKPARCSSFFPDSGAHSLYTHYVLPQGKKKDRYQFYVTPDGKFTLAFKDYLDAYARFIRKYEAGIDYYVTVDAIYNAEISWDSLKYLEEVHGLNPIPVIHHRTPMKWIDKYLEAGYGYLGVGGLGQESSKAEYTNWADHFYQRICPASNGHKPLVKTHGFAMTAYSLLIRYPWYSVDSVSWAKASGFGGTLYVPHRRNGKWDFGVPPYNLPFSFRSSSRGRAKGHFLTLSKGEQAVVLDWLAEIDMPLGSLNEDGSMKEYGVFSTYHAAATANVRFFNRLCDWLPPWPWAFKPELVRNRFVPQE